MLVLLSIFLFVTLGFIISIFTKRNDIADVMWGPGIFLAVLVAFLNQPNKTISFYLFLLLIGLWALRIFIHIGLRFISKTEEDFRYKVWRETWKYFYLRSYLQVFLLQGFLMILVSSSATLFISFGLEVRNPYFIIGSILALGALIFETFADQQLKNFLKLKTGGIMNTGLWKYSRHPNYFGEVSFWWSIFIMTIPSSSIFFINPLFLISPLTISFLILYVSGIPLVEKKYDTNAEFQIYKSKTSAFFPWFPKK